MSNLNPPLESTTGFLGVPPVEIEIENNEPSYLQGVQVEIQEPIDWQAESAKRTVNIEVIRQALIITGAIASIPFIEYAQKQAGSFIDKFAQPTYYVALLGLYPFLYKLGKNHYESLQETGVSTSNVFVTGIYRTLSKIGITPNKANLITAATLGTIAIPAALDLLTTVGSQITAYGANLALANMPANLDVKLFLGATLTSILASYVQASAVKAETSLSNQNIPSGLPYLMAGFKEMMHNHETSQVQ
jgi:hypothetical protein